MKTAAVVALVAVLGATLVACNTPEAEGEVDIVGTTWQWLQYEDMAEEGSFSVDSPESYTLTLQEDGNASIQADCNQVTWTYTMEGSSLEFDTTGPSTLAFCGEDSMDQVYLERLGNTATYVVSDGNLFLNLLADAGNMEFAPAE